MRPLPIRMRLTLWYFAMFSSAAALLSCTSFWMLRHSMDAAEYHELQERSDDVQLILQHENPARTIQQIGDDFAAIYTFKDDGKYLQVKDNQGNWIYRSKRMIAQNPDLQNPSRLRKEGVSAQFLQAGHNVRTESFPIFANGTSYSVQTGMSLDKSIALMGIYRTNLLLLTPIVILLAAVGGHLMSRKALRPVAALAAEARLIHDRNLDRRLPVPRAQDEIYDLSLTLNQMLERIDRAFASVRTFTGNASHELRTPISLLRTEIEVALIRSRDGEEYRTILGHLLEETERMTGLLENLLSLARADGGAETILLAPISLDALFQHTAETWKRAMSLATLDFRIDFPNEELFVLGDEHGVPRLLAILLENASKFTPPGGSVTLRAAVVKDRAVISVEDTGVGIAPDHLERIFDRFYRVASGNDAVRRGSGLGLSLGKWIAERHATELRVTSSPGCGSCFSFALKRTYPVVMASEAWSGARGDSRDSLPLPARRTC